MTGNGGEVVRVVLNGDGWHLSALRATPATPRGVVIALHGGAHDAQYFHHPSALDNSLLHLGADLGFDVVALDRPGNGHSVAGFSNGATFAEQVRIIHDLSRSLGSDRSLPIFLIGHSLGAKLALLAVTSAEGAAIAGIEVAGAPLRFTPEKDQGIRASLAQATDRGDALLPRSGPEMLRAMFFGADGTFDPAVINDDPVNHQAVVKEIKEVVDFPAWAQETVETIGTPLRWTFAAQEVSSLLTPELPAEVAHRLRHSRDGRIVIQQDNGHNISLHRVGRAYHLSVLAFFEEMIARNMG